MSKQAQAKEVDSYLAKVPEPARATLKKVRGAVRAAAPKADEVISYKMPAFKYGGKFLVSYSEFKKHCSLFPLTESAWSALKDELEAAGASKAGKATLRFPVDKPIPATLVKKIVKMRIKELESE